MITFLDFGVWKRDDGRIDSLELALCDLVQKLHYSTCKPDFAVCILGPLELQNVVSASKTQKDA